MLSPVNWKRKFLIFLGATVLFAAIGPFDTFSDLSLGERLVYWALTLFGCGALMHIVIELALQASVLPVMPRAMRLAAGAVAAAFPCTLVVYLIDGIMRPADGHSIHWIETWFAITLIGIAIGYLNFMPPFASRPRACLA
jgi:hypothetical protein